MSEWTVRPNFRSPQKPIVRLSKRPFSRLMVSRSVSVCVGWEADHLSAQLEHRGCKAQARAGRGFVEERGEFLALAGFAVFGAVGDDVLRESHDLLGLFDRQIGGIDQMTHRRYVIN